MKEAKRCIGRFDLSPTFASGCATALLVALLCATQACSYHAHCKSDRPSWKAKGTLPDRKGGEDGRPANAGLMVTMGGLAGSDMLAMGTSVAIVSRGTSLDLHLGMGATVNALEDVYGMVILGGARVNWPYSSLAYPKLEASFTNLSEHWGTAKWNPRWLLATDLGVDLVVYRGDLIDLVVSPSLALGMTQQDTAILVGARREIETHNKFFVGGRVGLTLVVW